MARGGISPVMAQIDTFKTRTKLPVGGVPYDIFSLKTLQATVRPRWPKLPFSLKVLLENLLRYEDGRVVKKEHVEALVNWNPKVEPDDGDLVHPGARALAGLHRRAGGGRPGGHARGAGHAWAATRRRSTRCARSIWSSITRCRSTSSARTAAFQQNVRHRVRSATPSATRSSSGASRRFKNFRVVPPGTGICHQVNLEYLAQAVFEAADGVGLPRHAGGHRLAHHHDQRPGRGGLGRGRHRGRGGHARPAASPC